MGPSLALSHRCHQIVIVASSLEVQSYSPCVVNVDLHLLVRMLMLIQKEHNSLLDLIEKYFIYIYMYITEQ